ncbi:glycosyltransferase family 9 protein [Arthrobacter agilis]|uniref:glycosyltransferase family 9 protein n=1 Tax=Arthrobacter agilis TaxID=37921 RepID=UPI000B3531E7|nr:glycosyltransferase family 9 protein [Arthrobacter agilis]OUM44204.1 glycosyl transferase [Arthrobacter agilis]PPB46578.1 glycosyltransferase family 9 protein [Arthrobacter agilis]TPV23764.1 glycosyltransferase family 9 protein [Arthrobacter agilis]VDR32494.1 ADP-heptose--LPS heptosyltransferase 2 [Arthrobacter agilis]
MAHGDTTADFGGQRDTTRSVGPVLPPFEDVRRIAVLRGGGLGDLMFALPAIAALKARYPGADITLLGMPGHAALLEGRPGPVSRVVELPYSPGVRPGGAVDGTADADAVDAFFEGLAGSFDLAVQLHGGGRNSNPFLLRLGARHTIGTRTPDAPGLERTIPYVYYQHEVFRALEVVGLAGAVPVDLEPRVAVTPAEAARAAELTGTGPVLALHPGATDARRRWPAASFAEIAVRAAADGCEVVVVGDAGDAAAAEEIVRIARATSPSADVRSLAGQLSLGDLAGILDRSAVMVGNDSGPRHLAQAVGTPTIGVYWIGNVINAGAIGRSLHRVHFSWISQCPVCGVDVTQVGWTAQRCEHDDSFVATVQPEAVYADVAELRATSLLLRGR